MDRFSPVAAAHVRVLVLPVGRIERDTFLRFVRRLQDEAAIIQYQDLKDHVGDSNFLLSPRKFERGCLLLNYTTSSVSEAVLNLSPYDIFREPLLVVGVVRGLGEDEEEARKELKAATDFLRERHPRVVHRHLLVLQEGEDKGFGKSDSAALVEQALQSGHPSLTNAMHGLAIRFLRELSTYVQAMQASPSIPTPGQTARSLQRVSWMRDADSKSASGSGYGTPRDVSSPPPGEDGPSRPPSRSLTSPSNSIDQNPSPNTAAGVLARSDSNRGHNARASSQDRVALQGFGTNTSAEKTKKRGKARVNIVVGSLYMMAGMWMEALQLLTEHTGQARILQDHLWCAKGLENIVVCQLLQAWAEIDFQVPTLCQQVVEKSLSKQTAQRFSADNPGESATTREATLRRLSGLLPDLVRQIVILYRSNEGPLELPSLIVCEATVRLSKLLAMLHNNSGTLNKSALEQIVSAEASDRPLSATSPGVALKTSTNQSSRLLAGSAIAEVLVTGMPTNDDSIAVQDHLTILGGVASVYSILRMDRKKAMTIKELVVRLTAALNQARKLGAAEMGIHPAASLSAEHGAESLTASIKESGGLLNMIADVANIYGVHLIGGSADPNDKDSDQHLQNTRARAFGGEGMKFGTLRDLLALCEASPDPYGILRLIASFFASAGPRGAVDNGAEDGGVSIAQDEQAHLASTISRTIGVSKQLGLKGTQAEYWDPYLLRGITFSPRQTAVELIDWAKLKGARPSTSDLNPGNPLLYDPNARRQATAEQSAVLVQGEPIDCLLTLQNPYEVGLDIESIQLVTEGAEMKAAHGTIHIAPAKLQQISISVTPSTTGKAQIKGCRVKMTSFREQYFPIIRKPWSEQRSLVVKHLGQDARSGDHDPKQKLTEAETATVTVEVISNLPTLALRGTSLVESSLMLLEGEKHTFEAIVENTTDQNASILDVVGSAAGLYVAKESVAVINPKESAMITLEVVGRAGMSHLRADVFYAGPGKNVEFARMLSVPITVTVNAALQAHHLDVSESDADDLICVSFDLGNAWPKSVSFSCSTFNSDSWDTQYESSMAPGEVQRIYLKLRRWVHETKPDQPSPDELRKVLLDRFRITWSVDARNGHVPLHNLALPAEAIDTLRGPSIAVQLSLQDKQPASIGSFLTLRATIRNRSTRSAPLLVELLPRLGGAAPEDRRRAVAGSLSRFVAALEAGESKVVDFAFCPLLVGRLVLTATAREALSLCEGEEGEVLGESRRLVVAVA
ncbi:hypothetical protein WHR41_09177 [Cladosporium halotolerans]|uniref:Hypercellular protein HypA n=1 Tax=Cladosporium halotolerans TaxID=1052096 RepID=A0AB34KF00_9PEZI